ncbi:MAG: DUF1566 domain-containing protein [Thermodesulfobacteriota bacterium]
MRFTGNYRISILFVILVCISVLYGCAESSAPEKGKSSSRGVLVEDLGNGLCLLHHSGLMWQIDESKKIATYEEADAYAQSLEFAGFSDWRLPTRDECQEFSELMLMKKGNCPIVFKRPHWVARGKRHEAGYWDDYPLCGGSELRWVKGKQGTVRAVRP